MDYKVRHDGMVERSDGVTIPPDPANLDYQQFLAWQDDQPEPLEPEPEPERAPTAVVAETLREQAEAALATNRTAGQQNAGIIAAAQTMEAFAGASLTQAQIITALKDLARGVRILAEHDQAGLVQRNALIRLTVGALDATD